MSNIIAKKILGDSRESLASMPAGSVHVCVTSPPYYGLRQYLRQDHPDKAKEIGSESSFELYLEHILEVFREVHRVMRPDGTLWLNLGDRYSSAGRNCYDVKSKMPSQPHLMHPAAGLKRPADIPGLKPKDLCLAPQRIAMALQAEGWHLRAMIPWLKRNCMPESVKDRPVTALEYFFMLTKTEDYYYDRYAVMKKSSLNTHPRAAVFPRRDGRISDDNRRRRRVQPKAALAQIGTKQNPSFQDSMCDYLPTTRNRRNTDWFMESWEGMICDEEGDPLALIVNPKGTTIAHFASYPVALVKPCIEASTSEKGCCPICGAPLHRIIEKGEPDIEHQQECGGDLFGLYTGKATKDYDGANVQNASDVKRRILAGMMEYRTAMWVTGCDCLGVNFTPNGQLIGGYHTVPCTVLDPFCGVSSTAAAALDLGRNFIGCDINEEYLKAGDERDSQSRLVLL